LCGKTAATSPKKKEEQMDSRTELKVWLQDAGTDAATDPVMLAVHHGTAAQAMIGAAVRDVFELGEIDAPDWLALWAANLTSGEVARIVTWRDAEMVGLREDIERLLGDEPDKWTDAERAHAEAVGRRISAVNLVLRARDAVKLGEKRISFQPTAKKAAQTAA